MLDLLLMEFLVNCLAAGTSLGEIIVKMFIQRLITFTLIVFCSVLLSVEDVCLSEVCDQGQPGYSPPLCP